MLGSVRHLEVSTAECSLWFVLEIEAVLQELNGLAKDLPAEHCEYVHFAHDSLS